MYRSFQEEKHVVRLMMITNCVIILTSCCLCVVVIAITIVSFKMEAYTYLLPMVSVIGVLFVITIIMSNILCPRIYKKCHNRRARMSYTRHLANGSIQDIIDKIENEEEEKDEEDEEEDVIIENKEVTKPSEEGYNQLEEENDEEEN